MVTMAEGIHLFPYRTQKLSLLTPMVLGGRPPGRLGSCQTYFCEDYIFTKLVRFFDKFKSIFYNYTYYVCLGSSMVEHPAVNRQVVGSSPTLSAKCRGGGTGRRTGLKILRWSNTVSVRFRFSAPITRDGAAWWLVGLITRRSQVQILLPQPYFLYVCL